MVNTVPDNIEGTSYSLADNKNVNTEPESFAYTEMQASCNQASLVMASTEDQQDSVLRVTEDRPSLAGRVLGAAPKPSIRSV